MKKKNNMQTSLQCGENIYRKKKNANKNGFLIKTFVFTRS